tara:strand:- start:4245 stop:4652 length:408 start_codon:yes stop_codon:yes gene_type:complete
MESKVIGVDLGKKGWASSYMAKINKANWKAFKAMNKDAGYGMSLNQRVNFWFRDADLLSLGLVSGLEDFPNKSVKCVSLGSKPHHWVIQVYDLEEYNGFKSRCKEVGLTVGKAINLLIKLYLETGYITTVNRFRV